MKKTLTVVSVAIIAAAALWLGQGNAIAAPSNSEVPDA